MKNFIVCMLFVVSTIAEPPVENRYLPPQRGGNLGAPSSTYGVPGGGNGGSHGSGRQTSAIFGGRQSSSSPRIASRRPSSQYGAPNAGFSGAPSNQYGPPMASFSAAPSSQYGAPSAQFSGAPSNQYGAPSAQFSGAPSNQYGAPSAQFSGAPSTQYGAPDAQVRQPSSQYGAPSQGGARGFSSQSPSDQYGAPAIGGIGASGYTGAEQSRQYLPPGGSGRGGYGGGDGSNGEPANYSFEYMVKDESSGNDFGHRESRQGDRAEGLYYVLLPDGRKQTVEYEADQEGYRPRISYEDTGAGGYPGSQGYGGDSGY